MLDTKIYNLLPKKMQQAGNAMRQLHASPDEQLIPLMLSVANYATQGHFDIDPASVWKKSAMSLMTVVLNKSAGRKTESLNEFMDGIKRFKKQEVARYEKEVSIYNAAHKKWEKDFTKAVENNLPHPKEPSKPIGHLYLLDKATSNGLMDALHSVPFTGLINSDAAEFFNSHSFQDSKSGRDTEMITMLSKLFSGESVSRQTGVSENNIIVDGRRFSMLAMLQAELASFLKNKKYRDQGFIPRLLISVVPDYDVGKTVLGKKAQESKKLLRQDIEPFNDRIYELLCQVTPKSDKLKQSNALYRIRQSNTHVADDLAELELDLIHVCETDKALQLFEDYANLSIRLIKQPEYAGYASFMSRRFELALRVAATLAVFEGDTEITERWAEAAIGIMDFFTQQRLDMDLPADKNETLDIGEELIDWMKKKGITEISATDAVQRGPSVWRNTKAAQRREILDELSGSRDLIVLDTNDVTKKVTIKLKRDLVEKGLPPRTL